MKTSFKEFITVNLIIVMTIGILYLFTFDNRMTAVLSPAPEAIYQGNREEKNVSLMFNVYWGTEYIPGILEILEKENVKTTFFIGGMWAKTQPEALKAIHAKGHELGNHGFMHKQHSQLTREQNEEEITEAEQVIEELTGVKTVLFAPPSGDFDDEVLQIASALGYETVMWSKDTIDWRDHNVDLICQRAVSGAENGGLILMHPTKETLAALPEMIKQIKAKGFHLTTVSQTIQKN